LRQNWILAANLRHPKQPTGGGHQRLSPLALAAQHVDGTLDLHTGQLQPHDPADMLTKLVQANYDADAHCPIWLAFLARVQPDPAIRTFLQRSIGYSPTGLVSEQLRLWLAT
jgi:phage/plasmid-associated DNA primase